MKPGAEENLILPGRYERSKLSITEGIFMKQLGMGIGFLVVTGLILAGLANFKSGKNALDGVPLEKAQEKLAARAANTRPVQLPADSLTSVTAGVRHQPLGPPPALKDAPLSLEIIRNLDAMSGGSDALLTEAQLKEAIDEIERFETDGANSELSELVGDLNLKKAQYLAMSNRKEEALQLLKEFEESDENAGVLQCEIAHVKMLGGDEPQSIIQSARDCAELKQGQQARTLLTGVNYFKQTCGKDCAKEVAQLSSMLGGNTARARKAQN